MPDGLTTREVEPGVWQITDPGYAQPSHAFLVIGNERAGLIDSGTGIWDIRGTVESLTSLEIVVLQSHAHPDHAGGSHQFDLVMAHPEAAEKLQDGWDTMELRFELNRLGGNRTLPEDFDRDRFSIPGCPRVEPFENRGVVDLGGRQVDVFFTPGHSPDSVCILDLDNGLLFTGDSVVKGRIAVENSRTYRRSLTDIVKLAELARAIYPAHGDVPVEPAFVRRVRQGFADAITDRHPSGFLAGFATFEFDDFGIMLPPRRRRVREE
ncbi:MBL fold metallo-hydrolase [soil metagenome]